MGFGYESDDEFEVGDDPFVESDYVDEDEEDGE